MNIVILQARMSSTRLPGKVMKEVSGKSLLQHQILRISDSKYVDEIIVATSLDQSDDVLVEHCIENNIKYFRGSLTDVLNRYYEAVKKYKGQVRNVIRLTADCPFVDSQVIDLVLLNHILYKNDYTSNTLDETFPDGLDVEVISVKTLNEIWMNASLQSEREHVTLYIKNRLHEFKTQSIIFNGGSLCHERWTVDEKKDFEFVKKIYELLYPHNNSFKLNDILSCLSSNTELRTINSNITRNEGLKKSLANDYLVKRCSDE